jgi:hypothetical protein
LQSAQLSLDRPFEFIRLEAKRSFTALKGNSTVSADEVEPIGPAAIRGGYGVVDSVDDQRQLQLEIDRAGGRDSPALLVSPRFVHRKSRAAILGKNPPLLRVCLADVDDKEVHVTPIPGGQLLERPNLGAEGRSGVRTEDQCYGEFSEERGEAYRARAVETRKLKIGSEVTLADLRCPEVAVISTRHDILQLEG